LQETCGVEAELVRGAAGVFDVEVDGARVFSKHEAGRFPEPDEIVAAVRAR
jgi:selT/selW/selH-like putative selenoprotein